jgi:outer membrane protein OmpA-like peptidoglycan-associated protein
MAAGCASPTFVRDQLAAREASRAQALRRLDAELARDGVDRLAAELAPLRSIAEAATRLSIEALGRADEAAGRASEAAARADDALAQAVAADGLADRTLGRLEQVDRRLARPGGARQRQEPAGTVVIRFGFDRWTLDARAEAQLRDVVARLQASPERVVHVQGHTDRVGPDAYNLELSERRAEAVRRFLVLQGIEAWRIRAIGLGPSASDDPAGPDGARGRSAAVTLLAPVD